MLLVNLIRIRINWTMNHNKKSSIQQNAFLIMVILFWFQGVNSFKPRQNGRHFADDFFKRIFSNENAWISLKISLKFVTKVPINNIPALVQIMAWRRPGDMPLSGPMMVNLMTPICVTRPQWVNSPSSVSKVPCLALVGYRQRSYLCQ